MKNLRSAILLVTFALAGLFSACDKFEEDVLPARSTALTLNDDTYTTKRNQQVQLNVLANDSISGQATVQYGQPANGTLITNNNGTVFYKPTANFLGHDSLSYQVCMGSNCATALVRIQVLPDSTIASCILSAKDDSAKVQPNQTVTVNILQNDNACSATPVLLTQSIKGQATINANNQLVYTAFTYALGAEVLQYKLTDNTGKSVIANAVVEFTPGNVPCLKAYTDTVRVVRHNGAFADTATVNVLKNDKICAGGGPLVLTVLSPQTNYGTAMVIGQWPYLRILYNTSYKGPATNDHVSYRICQGNMCSTATVQVELR